MRLFIAINFPQELKEKIGKTIEKIVSDFPQVSWTKKENTHLTLKFFGYVNENQLEKIKEGISKSIEGVKPFSLTFTNLGFFDREQLIIWVGLSDCPELMKMVNNLEKEMKKLGFAKEKRIYSPHVTLGRGKKLSRETSQKIRNIISQETKNISLQFKVSEITLMESKLTSSGPKYFSLSQFALS